MAAAADSQATSRPAVLAFSGLRAATARTSAGYSGKNARSLWTMVGWKVSVRP